MIQTVDKPHLFPQRCFFTGDASEKPIIDTGVNDTEGGRVYMSIEFFGEIAKVIGFAPREEIEALQTENDRLSAINNKLPEITEKVADVIRSAASAAVLDLVTAAGDGAGVDDLQVPEDAPGDVTGATGSAGTPDRQPRRPGRAAKSASSEQDLPGL